jgi:hypothetical protein
MPMQQFRLQKDEFEQALIFCHVSHSAKLQWRLSSRHKERKKRQISISENFNMAFLL